MIGENFGDVQLFKEWLIKKNPNLKESSIYLYVGGVKCFLANNPDINNLDSYNDFIVGKTIKKNALHYYTVIKYFIQYKITDANQRNRLLEGLVKPREKDPKTVRDYYNDKKLLEVVNSLQSEKHQVLALIQMKTGVRVNDILKIKRGNITREIEKGKDVLILNITDAKGGKRHPVPIYDNVLIELIQKVIIEKYNPNEQHEEYYFLDYNHPEKRKYGRHIDKNNILKLKTMNYDWYWEDLKQALHMNGLNPQKFATHDFRRCFARNMWEFTKHDLNILQRVLNHSDPKTTMRYLRYGGLDTKDILRDYSSRDNI